MKKQKPFGFLIIGLCFLVIAGAALWSGSAPKVIEYLKRVASQPKPEPEKNPLDQVALDQVFEALESAGLMNMDFKPAMVHVEAGTLPAASDLAGKTIAAFAIGKYEVTYGEWQKVQNWALLPQNRYDLNGAGRLTSPQSPVVGVSWFDALKWCNARSEMEGLTPVYQVNGAIYKTGEAIPTVNPAANGYRLPTDAEWEWAASGGVLSQDFIYSGSDEVNEVAWYFGSFVGEGTKAVGTKLENELGIHDMSGNVFEWCWDPRSTQNPQRIIRGGCWAYHADECAVRHRASAMNPDVRVILVGLRIARNAT
jgi:sulfatase modifying factor 1